MGKAFFADHLVAVVAGGLALCGLWTAVSPGQVNKPSGGQAAANESLKGFLQTYVRASSAGDYSATRYSPAFVRLDGGMGAEAIVYLTGDGWCGSGGCSALVLSRGQESWRVVTKVTIAWPPIRVLESESHGWHDIAVWVRGGGVRPGYEAVLHFDGQGYPPNPTVPPAQPLSGGSAGRVVISSADESVALYP
jgi:hypothetical protein